MITGLSLAGAYLLGTHSRLSSIAFGPEILWAGIFVLYDTGPADENIPYPITMVSALVAAYYLLFRFEVSRST